MSDTEQLPTLSESQLSALKKYADENGRTWKSKLNDDWCHARQAGELQQIRNAFGPTWLTRFNFDKPKTHCAIR